MGDTGGGLITKGFMDAVSCQVHSPPTGNSGMVVFPNPTSGCLRVGYRLRGERQEETTVVETGADIGGAEENMEEVPGGWGGGGVQGCR